MGWSCRLGLSGLLFLASCASNPLLESKDPEAIYGGIVKLVQDEDFFEGRELIDSLKRRFPQSRFASLANLRLADIEYAEDNFTEAAALYGVFVDLHPTHLEAPYAQYRKALAYYEDAPNIIARDQSTARHAEVACAKLIERYPNSKFVPQAKELMVKSRLKLARKEDYIASFYEKMDEYPSARNRWIYVLAMYADLERSDLRRGKEVIERARKKIDLLADKIKDEQNDE